MSGVIVWVLLILNGNGEVIFTSPHRYASADSCSEAVSSIEAVNSMGLLHGPVFTALCIPQPRHPLEEKP